jgi:hypothetical protein
MLGLFNLVEIKEQTHDAKKNAKNIEVKKV